MEVSSLRRLHLKKKNEELLTNQNGNGSECHKPVKHMEEGKIKSGERKMKGKTQASP